MPFICSNPERLKGKVFGEGKLRGQCPLLVQVSCTPTMPQTRHWKAGVRIKGALPGSIVYGTAIATFVGGKYPNDPNDDDGKHAAIYLSHDESGITVLDQWVGNPTSERTIPFGAGGYRSNDGDWFHVIER